MPALLHKTRFSICAKAERKNAASVSQVIIDQLKMNICVHLPPNRRNEFSYHIGVNETLKGGQFYSPLTHHPWQRGSNENTNSRIFSIQEISTWCVIQMKVDKHK